MERKCLKVAGRKESRAKGSKTILKISCNLDPRLLHEKVSAQPMLFCVDMSLKSGVAVEPKRGNVKPTKPVDTEEFDYEKNFMPFFQLV